MKALSAAFEKAGMTSVRTYINTGNVIFSSKLRSKPRLAALLEEAIKGRFGLEIPVVVRDLDEMRAVVAAMPSDWVNDSTMKCDVMFLWKDVDRPSILKDLSFKPEMEDVLYVPGAIIWRVDRKDATRSGIMKLAGSPLYKRMSIRNCNTARKILQLMEA